MLGLVKKIFGSANDRLIKKLEPTVERINRLEPELVRLSDAALRARTDALKERPETGETLDDLLPDAFATAPDAAKRTRRPCHSDAQLIVSVYAQA